MIANSVGLLGRCPSDFFSSLRYRVASAFLLSLIILIQADRVSAQTRSPRPLRVAYLSTSATMTSLWMAKETGGFAKEGIDVEVLSIGSSVAIPALIANELDAVQVSAAPVLIASLRGIDVTFIAG